MVNNHPNWQIDTACGFLLPTARNTVGSGPPDLWPVLRVGAGIAREHELCGGDAMPSQCELRIFGPNAEPPRTTSKGYLEGTTAAEGSAKRLVARSGTLLRQCLGTALRSQEINRLSHP